MGIGNAWGEDTESFTIDNVVYLAHFGTGSTEYAEVTGLSEGCNPELVIPQSIGIKVTQGYYKGRSYTCKVSVIAAEAFKNNTTLTSVTLSSDIDQIHTEAFSGCSNLEKVINMPSSFNSSHKNISEKAFYNCEKLTSITIPSNVTSIDALAFAGCTSLSLSIPANVTSIGEGAFAGVKDIQLSSTKNFTIEDGMLYNSGKTTLYYCDPDNSSYIVPWNVTAINKGAFLGLTSSTQIYIYRATLSDSYLAGTVSTIHVPHLSKSLYVNAGWPESQVVEEYYNNQVRFVINAKDKNHKTVENVNTGYFGVEFVAKEITGTGEGSIGILLFKSDVTTIGIEAFMGCYGLYKIDIPTSVTTIGTSAFEGCTGLIEVDLPNSVTSVSPRAFFGCKSTKSITIPASVTTIGESAFEGNCQNEDKEPATITFEEPRTTPLAIGDWAFTQCNLVSTVSVPAGTTMTDGAFCNCANLSSVTLPSDLTTVAKDLLKDCKNLTSISIPASVTTIGEAAFANCTSLTDVSLNSIPAGLEYLPANAVTITLTDASSASVGTISNLKGISYEREVSTTWGTLMLPFAISKTSNLKLYQLSAADFGNGVMSFTEVDDVAANVPCVFQAGAAGTLRFEGSDAAKSTLEVTASQPVTDLPAGWSLQGTYTKKVLDASQDGDIYFISNNKFMCATGTAKVTIKPFRAWFGVTSGSAEARNFTIEVVEKATGLKTILSKEESAAIMYDLMGRQQTSTQSGKINIINGKKTIVK